MYTIGSEHSWSSFVRRPVRSEYLLKHGMTTSRSRRLRRNGKVVVGGGDQQPRRECWCHRVMQRCCLTPHCVMREASRRSRCKLLTGYWFSVQTSLLGYAARMLIAWTTPQWGPKHIPYWPPCARCGFGKGKRDQARSWSSRLAVARKPSHLEHDG